MRLRRAGAELTVASFVVLFQELALIRWMGGEVRVPEYFPNVVLISAFLGLGIGALRAGKRSLLWTWPAAVALTTAATLLMARIAFTNRSPSEHLWLLYLDIPNAPVVHDVRPPIVIAFLLSAVSFVALGQLVGERLRDFTAAGATLYSTACAKDARGVPEARIACRKASHGVRRVSRSALKPSYGVRRLMRSARKDAHRRAERHRKRADAFAQRANISSPGQRTAVSRHKRYSE